MTTHTVQQWKLDDDGPVWTVSAHPKGIVAHCPLVADGGVFEAHANARLIAAAPTLYEALATFAETFRPDELPQYVTDALAKAMQ